MPGAGGTQRLTRTIGKAKAMEMVLTGAPIDATTAERLGLVNRVVPAEKVLDEAKAIGQAIATKPPISVKHAKQAVLKAFELPLTEAVEAERRLFYLLFGTEDAQEGISAFIEKRTPTFRGR
jgi:enoyl-CoA hydratase